MSILFETQPVVVKEHELQNRSKERKFSPEVMTNVGIDHLYSLLLGDNDFPCPPVLSVPDVLGFYPAKPPEAKATVRDVFESAKSVSEAQTLQHSITFVDKDEPPLRPKKWMQKQQQYETLPQAYQRVVVRNTGIKIFPNETSWTVQPSVAKILNLKPNRLKWPKPADYKDGYGPYREIFTEVDQLLYTLSERLQNTRAMEAAILKVDPVTYIRYKSDAEAQALHDQVAQEVTRIRSSGQWVIKEDLKNPTEIVAELIPEIEQVLSRAPDSSSQEFLKHIVERYRLALAARSPEETEQLIKKATVPLWIVVRSGEAWKKLGEKGVGHCDPVLAEPGIDLTIKGMRPLDLVISRSNSAEIVPNDIDLRQQTAEVLLASNGAGKSTLQRGTAAAAISANIGQPLAAELAVVPQINGVLQTAFTEKDWIASLRDDTSHHRLEMSQIAKVLSESSGNELIELEDLGLSVETRDGLAITLAILEELQKRRPYIQVSTHLDGLPYWAKKFGLKIHFSVIDSQSHKLRPLAEGEEVESGAIRVAEEMGLDQEIIALAKVLRQQDRQGNLPLKLDYPKREPMPNKSATFTDERTFHDIFLENDSLENRMRLKSEIKYFFQGLSQETLFKYINTHAADDFLERAIEDLFKGQYDSSTREQRKTLVEAFRGSNKSGEFKSVRDLVRDLIYPSYIDQDYILWKIKEYDPFDGRAASYVESQKFFQARFEKRDEYVKYVRGMKPQLDSLISNPQLAYLHSDFIRIRNLSGDQGERLTQLNIQIGDIESRKPKFKTKAAPKGLSIKERQEWDRSEKERRAKHEIEIRTWENQLAPVTVERNNITTPYASSLAKIYSWVAISQLFDYLPNTIAVSDDGSGLLYENGYDPFMLLQQVLYKNRFNNSDFFKEPYTIEGYSPRGFESLLWLKGHKAKTIFPTSLPKPSEEKPLVYINGQAGGGKTRALFTADFQIMLNHVTAHGIGDKIFDDNFRYLVSRIDPVWQTDKLSSYQSEIVNRAMDIVSQVKMKGPGGLILWDAPLEKYTSHNEAKYLLDAISYWLQQNGCYAIITTHVTELFDLLKKHDDQSKVRYRPVMVSSPYGETPYQFTEGESHSFGIETAEQVTGFPPEVIERARYFREQIEKEKKEQTISG